MVGKALAWKEAVTDSTLTVEFGRSFQRGITSGKKENLYVAGGSKDMCELMRDGWSDCCWKFLYYSEANYAQTICQVISRDNHSSRIQSWSSTS